MKTKISEFSLIDDEVRVFRINETFIQSGRGTKNTRKRFSLPVHSLKNYGPLNSQTTEKGEIKGNNKISNFNIGNFIVMLIY
jgi:hypothetical protein